jgi:hypothetical protein
MSRIFRRAISSQLTTWEKTVFCGANCSSVVLEIRRSCPFRTGAALVYLRGNGAPERSLSGAIEPLWGNLLRGKNCSWEKSRAESHLGRCFLNFQLKINVIRKYFKFQIYPRKPSVFGFYGFSIYNNWLWIDKREEVFFFIFMPSYAEVFLRPKKEKKSLNWEKFFSSNTVSQYGY